MTFATVALLALAAMMALYMLVGARTKELPNAEGGLGDLERYLAALLDAPKQSAFLIIEVGEADDFLQFAKAKDSLIVNFPLASRRQQDRRDAVETAARGLGLRECAERRHKGALDYDLGNAPKEIATRVGTLLVEGLGAELDRPLRFKWHQVEP